MAEYIPLSDLPTIEDIEPADYANQTVPPLTWDFELPPSVDADRLVVNLSAVERYQKVGTFCGSIVKSYQGDTTSFTPGVSGINPDGSAVASTVGVTNKVEKSRTGIIDPPFISSRTLREVGRGISIHNLNKPEIANKVSSEVQDKGMSRDSAWAQELDRAFRQSYRHVGKQHLIERTSKSIRRFDYAGYAYFGTLAVMHISHGEFTLIPEMWAGLQALNAASDAMFNKVDTGKTHLSERRWSIFDSKHQTDRYAVLCAMSGVSQLIGVRK